jgi:hypothetical protein
VKKVLDAITQGRAKWHAAKRTFVPTPIEQVAINVVAWTIVTVTVGLMVVVVYLWGVMLFG